MLNLKRLRSLIVVAEEGNLSRAATRLHLSQPALSRRIRELEKDLRFSLFERVGRGIRLTGEGRGFLAQCRDLLAHADAVEERAKAFASGEGGVLRAGASPQMLECLFPDLLVRYRARYPLVEVELVEGTSGDLETRIERGEIDFAVIAPARADRFDHRVLPSLVVLAAVARTHRLDGTTPIELRDIMDEPFLLLHHGYRSRQAFDAACRLANVRRAWFWRAARLITLSWRWPRRASASPSFPRRREPRGTTSMSRPCFIPASRWTYKG